MVKIFRVAGTIPQGRRSSHRPCCSGHQLASQAKLTGGQYPCDTFTGQAFSLGLLAALDIMGYQIFMLVDLGVCLQWSSLLHRKALYASAVSIRSCHTQSPFLSSWSVCEAGRVRGGGRNGLGCRAANDIKWYRYTKRSLCGRHGMYFSIGLKFDPQELVMRLVC